MAQILTLEDIERLLENVKRKLAELREWIMSPIPPIPKAPELTIPKVEIKTPDIPTEEEVPDVYEVIPVKEAVEEGTITIVVTDEEGKGIYAAYVTCTGDEIKGTGYTDAYGVSKFVALPLDVTYTLTAEKEGYEKRETTVTLTKEMPTYTWEVTLAALPPPEVPPPEVAPVPTYFEIAKFDRDVTTLGPDEVVKIDSWVRNISGERREAGVRVLLTSPGGKTYLGTWMQLTLDPDQVWEKWFRWTVPTDAEEGWYKGEMWVKDVPTGEIQDYRRIDEFVQVVGTGVLPPPVAPPPSGIEVEWVHVKAEPEVQKRAEKVRFRVKIKAYADTKWRAEERFLLISPTGRELFGIWVDKDMDEYAEVEWVHDWGIPRDAELGYYDAEVWIRDAATQEIVAYKKVEKILEVVE